MHSSGNNSTVNGKKGSKEGDKDKEVVWEQIVFHRQDTHDGFGPIAKDVPVSHMWLVVSVVVCLVLCCRLFIYLFLTKDNHLST